MDILAETDWLKSEIKVGLERKMSESGDLSKMTRKSSFQEGVCLVWKVIPHLVASFCTHSWPPSGHITQKSKFSWVFGQGVGGMGATL